MPFALDNQTPLPALLKAQADAEGKPHALLVAKCTWRLDNGRMAGAEQQIGLRQEPLRLPLGELALCDAQRQALAQRLGEEVIWLDHDVSPPKPLFDVVLAGYATRRAKAEDKGKPPASFEAGLRIGNHVAGICVHPPRYWKRGLLGYSETPLVAFVERVPLCYALADCEGGFALEAPEDQSVWLPWIEAIKQPSQRRKYGKAAAGLSYWPESAPHRLRHMGTYDDAWQDERAPALPKDFNPRFYNVAHPALQLDEAPAPGTDIRLANLGEAPVIDSRMPALRLAAQGTTAGGQSLAAIDLRPDTLLIEPEHNRLSMIWRAMLPNPSGRDALRTVRLFRPEGTFA